MRALRRFRLIDEINTAAARVALRAAIFMPVCFLLATLFLSDSARPFASFGAFILLAMVTFAGRPLPRLIAWITLVLVGCAFIAVGTWLSQYTVIAALGAGFLSFIVFYSGVVNPYFAAARSGAVLLIALPVMVEADVSQIDERLAGWLLACAVCIPATYLVWRLPWFGNLTRRSAGVARALSKLVREPGSEKLLEAASEEVWKLRKQFLSTPNRPTGATGMSAAIASLIDELAWTFGLIVNPGGGIVNDRPDAKALREEIANLLASAADLLEGRGDSLSVERIEQALETMIERNTETLRERAAGSSGEDEAAEIRHLDHEFRLRKLAYSAIDIARTAEVAGGKVRAPGVLGDHWSWADLGLQRVRGAGEMLARHAAFDSSWLRNSIRAALGIGLATLVADLVAVQNAFWVVLGTLSILRSNALGTRGSVIQALGGTLAGIILGSALIWLLGHEAHVLWVALPIAVFVAAYAQRAISFAAGQAGFAILVMVLYNLIEPAGWELGLVRIENVAIGCAVSLAVGLLVWPRGAVSLIRGALANSLQAGSALVRDRSQGVLEGRAGNRDDHLWADSVAASELLDSALRRYLDESTGDHVDRESLMALSAVGLRLRRTAYGIGQIPAQTWFRRPGPDSDPRMTVLIDRVAASYAGLGQAIASGGAIPKEPEPQDPSWLLETLRGDGEDAFGAGLAEVWLYENLQYLIELDHRYIRRARMLFEVSSENPPPTGDVPMPRPSPAATAGSGAHSG